MSKFIRWDHPDGERGAHGSRWVKDVGYEIPCVEVYALRFSKPELRIRLSDYKYHSNDEKHVTLCLDLDSAVEFANEILRLAAEIK